MHPNRKPIDFVITEKGCYECISHHKSKSGHCTFTINAKTVPIYRFIYEECFGEIPAGMVIRHKCDNPSCINPEHLEVGTHADNVADMKSRGRQAKGERVHGAKLSEDDVRAILADNTSSTYQLAEKYGVSNVSIGKIRNRITWKHVSL